MKGSTSIVAAHVSVARVAEGDFLLHIKRALIDRDAFELFSLMRQGMLTREDKKCFRDILATDYRIIIFVD